MSPTFLELIVAALLLWVAWQLGMMIGPRVVAAFLAFWRDGQTSYTAPRDPARPEKNITPPPTFPGKTPRPKP